MDQKQLLEQHRSQFRPGERRLGAEDVEDAESGVNRTAAEAVEEGEEERGERVLGAGKEELLAEAKRGGSNGGAGGGDCVF